jgi:hypothetical protein
VTIASILATIWAWPFRYKLLALAALVVLTELLLRRFARKSSFYGAWTRAFEWIGSVWTAILLTLVYVVAVGPVSFFMRVTGKDLLDRSLVPRPTYWRLHEPNPLGPDAAARHQF